MKTALRLLTTTLLFCSPGLSLIAEPTAAEPRSLDFTSVAKKAIPAVVSVKTRGSQKSSSAPSDSLDEEFWQRFFGLPRFKESPEKQFFQGQASGFLVSADGYIVTNAHVVRDSEEITILLSDGREFSAKLIGQDPNTDIAVVKIDGKDLPFLPLGDSAQAQVGERVAAIGNPFGLQASLTSGVLSAKGRNNLDLTALEDFLQTDAAINKGNSGGPLLNLHHEVIGMNTALASSTGGYMGIGFAIPSNMIKYVMNELIHKGKISRGYLGIVLQPITYDSAMALGIRKVEGALIAEVKEDSPAAKAGLKRGDVILKSNQTPIENASAFRLAVSLLPPGTELTLSILRNKQTQDVKVVVASFPEEGAIIADKEVENPLGIGVQELTPELAQKLGYAGEQGVVVNEVSSKGHGAFVGLKRGTLILEVNQQPVGSVDQYRKIVNGIQKGSHVLLLVRQDQATRYIAFTVR